MSKNLFICTQCYTKFSKWSGKCDKCGQWNTLEEAQHTTKISTQAVKLEYLNEITTKSVERYKTNIKEFDYVCGGGIVAGSVTLIGGEPGIGKSTILLQISSALQSLGAVIYISGEEATNQIKMRAQRLQIPMENVACASTIHLESIIEVLSSCKPALVIIDSIQTLYSSSIEGTPGTVAQLRVCSHNLIQWAKNENIPMIIVGHVTKDGALAGPKVIEHMVDCVLYFESERTEGPLRILRAVKNRFGPTDVLGIFEMQNKGLVSVQDASSLFLQNRNCNSYGSTVFPSIEGNRPIFVEMQALVSKSYIQMPRRSVVGWDSNRLSMLAAVLETQCGISLCGKDLYFNVVGGIRTTEPVSDLAAAIALISAVKKITISSKCIIIGEIGLSGKVRSGPQIARRIQEAEKLGFDTALIPETTSAIQSKMKLITILHIKNALQFCMQL